MQHRSPISLCPENLECSEINHLSLSHEDQSKSGKKFNNLDKSVEQLYKSLRSFRERLLLTSSEILLDLAGKLGSELELTAFVLNEKKTQDYGE